jgi:RNA exonuclease 4
MSDSKKRVLSSDEAPSSTPAAKKRSAVSSNWRKLRGDSAVLAPVLKKQPRASASAAAVTPVPLKDGVQVTRVLALDCEMVGTRDGESQAARVTVVNSDGAVVLDSYIAPQASVGDYRTAVSGVRPEHLVGAPSLLAVQRTLADLFKHRVVVGHSVDLDFAALKIAHPRFATRDTAYYRPLMRAPRLSHSLRFLAKEYLKLDIQTGEHNPIEDAAVAMRLYQMHAAEWEAFLLSRKPQHRKQAQELRKKRA